MEQSRHAEEAVAAAKEAVAALAAEHRGQWQAARDRQGIKTLSLVACSHGRQAALFPRRAETGHDSREPNNVRHPPQVGPFAVCCHPQNVQYPLYLKYKNIP